MEISIRTEILNTTLRFSWPELVRVMSKWRIVIVELRQSFGNIELLRAVGEFGACLINGGISRDFRELRVKRNIKLGAIGFSFLFIRRQ